MLNDRRDHAPPVPRRPPRADAPQARPHLQGHPAAVLLHLRHRGAPADVRHADGARGRAPGLHDDRAAAAARGAARDQGDAELQRRPGGRDRLGRAGHGRDPRDGGGDPRQHAEPVQPRGAVGAAGGLDVQVVRARGRDRAGRRPRLDLLHLRPVHLHERAVVRGRLQGRQTVAGGDLRPHLRRVDLGHLGDAALRQHGLRPAHARRRARLRVAARQAARHQPDAEAGRLDRARPAERLAARDGGRVRDVRVGRHLREADRDPQGRAPERQGRQALGQAARRSARSATPSPPR